MRTTSILAAALAALVFAGAAAAESVVAKGEYLLRIGNCAGCHTAVGGEQLAGGRPIDSRFGTFYAPNITPDAQTGIGDWSEADLWNALHEGERPDGSPLYPACPYPSYSRVRREDVAAIYAYLQTVPPVRSEVREHDLAFPVSLRPLVSLWQALFFEPAAHEPAPQQSAAWNRGAYLVEGLGHCSACHADRNAFGASRSGDNVPGYRVHDWYAPSLFSSKEAGLQDWPVEKGAELLKHGKAGDASTMGPMADVVYASLRYLTDDDALAIATYLESLPDRDIDSGARPLRLSGERLEAVMMSGGAVYRDHCQDCHGEDGRGTVAAPALAGNRAVTMADPANIVNIVRDGGYPPSTAGNPRPFGMPPFSGLSSGERAAVLTYIRRSWGNDASPVSSASVR